MKELEPEPNAHPTIDARGPEVQSRQESTSTEDNSPFQADMEPSPDRKNNSQQSRPDQTPWWKYLLEIAALLVVVAYTVASFRQVGAMNKTYIEIQKQTDAVQKSAGAAESAAKTAKETLEEVKKGGSDTHELAIAAAKQATASRSIANATKRQLDAVIAASRPYVGILSMEPVNEKPGMTTIVAALKNFGTVPAVRFVANWKVLINGVNQILKINGPDAAFTFNPGANHGLKLNVTDERWARIASGEDVLEIVVTVSYKGWDTEKEYGECEKRRYNRTEKAFMDMGACLVP